MICYITWYLTLRDILHYVIYHITRYITLRDILHHVIYYITWYITVRDILHYVIYYITWHIILRDILYYMICYITCYIIIYITWYFDLLTSFAWFVVPHGRWRLAQERRYQTNIHCKENSDDIFNNQNTNILGFLMQQNFISCLDIYHIQICNPDIMSGYHIRVSYPDRNVEQHHRSRKYWIWNSVNSLLPPEGNKWDCIGRWILEGLLLLKLVALW